jgi:uncharacterized protein
MYEWDGGKRASNLSKQGIDFAIADNFNWQAAIIEPDRRFDYREARFIAIGPVGTRLHVMVFTARFG